MPPLDPKDFPDIKKSTVAAINALTDDQLHVEVEKKGNSRFGAKKQPLLRAALAQRRETTGKENKELEPKPPELIQNILWVLKYGLKYWYLLLIAIVILLGLYIFKSQNNENTSNASITTTPASQAQNSGSTKTTLSAPNIRFSDGSFGEVALSMQARIDPERFLAAHSLYGSAEAATNSLLTSLRSIAINTLETKSQDFVRSHRVQIANEIIEKSKDAQIRTGYTVIEFSIGEIH